MEQGAKEKAITGPQKTYVVVLRARSSARFMPEEGFEVSFGDVPGSFGSVRFRVRTRWVDEGHEAPIPRELWIEGRGPAPSLDHAVANFGATGRVFSNLLSFTADTSVEVPEVHVAYDATPGVSEREFLEVFMPDERGHPREGRIARANELAAVFQGLQLSADNSRINRAIQQYALALHYWYFGGEWLALAHLYMAVETLTDAVIRYQCDKDGVDAETLASRQGIDTVNPESWKRKLQIWSRREIVFDGDNETYRKARYASTGIEHGFLELDEVNRNALFATEATFGYVRKAILRVLEISPTEFTELYERVPRDVGSLRKMVRGYFVGDGADPAPPNEEYPRLEWISAVKTMQREGEKFMLSFQEKFKVRCAPTYGFRGLALEVRGRAEPGANPVQLNEVAVVAEEATTDTSTDQLFNLVRHANSFATAVAAPGRSRGISVSLLNVFGIFSEQIALFEAIDVLIRDNRPVEAVVLLRSLILGACQLESIADHPNREGAAIRVKLDSLSRQVNIYKSDPSVVRHAKDQAVRYQGMAEKRSLVIPGIPPDIRKTGFYAQSAESLRFAEEVAVAGDLAASLHMETDDEGNRSLNTRIGDRKLITAVGLDAVDAIIASAVALAKILDWPLDEAVATEIKMQVKRMLEEANTGQEGEGI